MTNERWLVEQEMGFFNYSKNGEMGTKPPFEGQTRIISLCMLEKALRLVKHYYIGGSSRGWVRLRRRSKNSIS